jgi:hypothetical protein
VDVQTMMREVERIESPIIELLGGEAMSVLADMISSGMTSMAKKGLEIYDALSIVSTDDR